MGSWAGSLRLGLSGFRGSGVESVLKDFIGSFIILASTLPIDVDIPGLQAPECRYALTMILSLVALYGTGLVLTGDDGEGTAVVHRGQVDVALTDSVTRTKKYLEQQAKRDSRQPKKQIP